MPIAVTQTLVPPNYEPFFLMGLLIGMIVVTSVVNTMVIYATERRDYFLTVLTILGTIFEAACIILLFLVLKFYNFIQQDRLNVIILPIIGCIIFIVVGLYNYYHSVPHEGFILVS